jgi:hypothetical protein
MSLIFCFGLSAGCNFTNSGNPEVERVVKWANNAWRSINGELEGNPAARNWDEARWQQWEAEGRTMPGAEQVLLELIETKDDRLAPFQILQGLQVVGTAKSVPVLAAAMKEQPEWDDEDYDVVFTLGVIGVNECISPLAERLFNSNSKQCRERAAQALAKIGGAEVVEILQRALNEKIEEARAIERAINDAAGQIRGQSARNDSQR